ncbi:MAG: ferritin family protein [Chloroflexota bacterium]
MADTTGALKVLSQALKLEQEGRAFYLQAAELARGSNGEALFRSLADDEAQHADMITRQLPALEGAGAYVLLPDARVQPIDAGKPLFPPQRAAIKAAVGADPGIVDALHLALEREVESYDLYARAAAETPDAAGRQMYQWLAGAERTHFNLLMSNYEAYVDRGGWV